MQRRCAPFGVHCASSLISYELFSVCFCTLSPPTSLHQKFSLTEFTFHRLHVNFHIIIIYVNFPFKQTSSFLCLSFCLTLCAMWCWRRPSLATVHIFHHRLRHSLARCLLTVTTFNIHIHYIGQSSYFNFFLQLALNLNWDEADHLFIRSLICTLCPVHSLIIFWSIHLASSAILH